MTSPITQVRWASGSVVYRNETVGPAHDPYGRDVCELEVRGKKFKLYSCGLAGEWIECEDGTRYDLEEPWNDKDGRLAAREDFEAAVETLTGERSQFWWTKLPNMVYEARWRADPKLQAMLAEMDSYYGRCI